mmetsp:Transcript_76405/g.88830  ORF Transcript_76405/g.88830 Transcript_76405/m.88830 type:complete len:302 (+) Transcript_76405:193-1098(+)
MLDYDALLSDNKLFNTNFKESKKGRGNLPTAIISSKNTDLISLSSNGEIAVVVSSRDPNIKYIDNVDDNDTLYYPMIQLSLKIFDTALELNKSDYPADLTLIYEEKKEDHKLKIYLSSYLTPEKNRVNKIRAEFLIPVTPEQFAKFLADLPEQRKIDEATQEKFGPYAKINEGKEPSFTILYLSYKKQMIASARDLVYIKTCKMIDEETYADASISVEHPELPPIENYVRCENKGGGHYVKLLSGKAEGKPVSLVKMCSEADFKANVPEFMAKTFAISSLKGHIEKSIKRMKELYPHVQQP